METIKLTENKFAFNIDKSRPAKNTTSQSVKSQADNVEKLKLSETTNSGLSTTGQKNIEIGRIQAAHIRLNQVAKTIRVKVIL